MEVPLIFLTSSAKPIDPKLKDLVEEIEQQSPSLSVLAARQFRYCVSQTPVQVTISKPRKLNVLEEFILRAGVELAPPPTEDELATVLGLDPIFIKSTTANLRTLNILEVGTESVIKLTPIGRDFYTNRSLPQSLKTKEIYAIYDPLSDHPVFVSSPLKNEEVDNLPDFADFVITENKIINVSALSLYEVQTLIQNSSLGLHSPEEGKIVTSFKGENTFETIRQSLSFIVIFDALEKEIKLEARRGKKILEDASNCLNTLLAQKKISLNTLCELTDEEVNYQCQEILKHKNAEVEERIENIRNKAQQEQPLQGSQTNKIEVGTVMQLRGSAISQELEKILNSARDQILIYSPWVSARVVNDRFIKRLKKLADQGVWTLIGHGIANSEEAEERPIPPQVEAQLRAIHTPEGIPAVQVFWLGGSHAKEVIIDKKIHLLGSNNLLSYRASSGLWDESIYKVTIPEQVQQAYDFYAKRFQAKAQELWNKAVQNQDPELAYSALYLWGALGSEEIARKSATA